MSDLARIKEEDPALFEQVHRGHLNVHKALQAFKSSRQERAAPGATSDGRQGGGVTERAEVGMTAEKPAPDQDAASSKGGQSGGGKTKKGAAARGKKGVAANSATKATRTRTCGTQPSPVPQLPTPDIGQASLAGWTVDSVGAALDAIEGVLANLRDVADDPKAAKLIREIDKTRRAAYSASCCALREREVIGR